MPVRGKFNPRHVQTCPKQQCKKSKSPKTLYVSRYNGLGDSCQPRKSVWSCQDRSDIANELSCGYRQRTPCERLPHCPQSVLSPCRCLSCTSHTTSTHLRPKDASWKAEHGHNTQLIKLNVVLETLTHLLPGLFSSYGRRFKPKRVVGQFGIISSTEYSTS